MSSSILTKGGNFYTTKDYLTWDMKAGVLRSRGGARIMAFPQCFMIGLFDGLEDECGQAWSIVLYRCGEWWGKRQMERMEKNLSEHFESPLSELPTAQVHASIQEAWATEGWGRMKLNLDNLEKGILHVTVTQSPISAAYIESGRDAKGRPVDSLTAGAVAGMFSHAAKADLVAHQTTCIVAGAPVNEYLVGLRDRLKDVPAMQRKGMTTAEIIANLKEAK
jgi:uncharacterized protein